VRGPWSLECLELIKLKRKINEKESPDSDYSDNPLAIKTKCSENSDIE
jgi:hypothetical protein